MVPGLSMSGWAAVDVVGWVAWWNESRVKLRCVACEKIRNGGFTFFYGEGDRDGDSNYELSDGLITPSQASESSDR